MDDIETSDAHHANKPRGKSVQGELGSRLTKVAWENEELVPFKKDIHVEHPELKAMPNDVCRNFLQSSNITIKGMAPIPKPMLKFDHAQLPDYILNLFKSEQFQNPTSIQSIGWPIALNGRDGVFIANTGSGKSLGFIIPMLLHIGAQAPLRTGDGPIALVLAPTRELVMQISKEASKFGRPGGVLNAPIYGGVSRNGQANSLRQGVEICIATPGRLIDLLDSGVTNLKRVTYLVLDEADRMLDMGFEPQIRKIVSQIRPDKQTTMYSASWNKDVQSIARDYCTEDPVLVTVGSSTLQANPDIKQLVTVVESESDKRTAFKKWLSSVISPEDDSKQRMIIFTDTKKGADNLCRELTYNGYSALSIHGDKEQRERDQILRDFRSGSVSILVATDVAARGLDIPGIDYVVNFDTPNNPESYLHRIGRCGRAGNKGTSMTFIAKESDATGGNMMKEIAKMIKGVGQQVPQELVDAVSGPAGGELRSFMKRR
jgi:ATP-dependent RNA helicase DDX5/DBP2